MTLEEAIIVHENTAKTQRDKAEHWYRVKENSISKDLYDRWARECVECAEEHEQLAKWLHQLRAIKTIMDLPVYSEEDLIRYKAICAVFEEDSDK